MERKAQPVTELQPKKPKSIATGHTAATRSVDTPGLISSIALSSHSQHVLPLTALLIGVMLNRGGASDIERAAVAVR
jgi:hypothetical protein